MRRIASLLAESAGVVSFDFRGHGRSAGSSTVGDREILDLDAAVRWATDLGYPRLATLGFSMGAAVAIRHAGLLGRSAGNGGLTAIAAVSGPARWYYRGTIPMRRAHWVIERRLGRIVGRLALRTRIAANGWDPLPEPPHEMAARDIADHHYSSCMAMRTRTFRSSTRESLYDAAAQPKELWIEPGFGHAENAVSADLLRRIGTWFRSQASR